MADVEDTLAPGRYDFIAFSNGGWECIGKQAAYPVVPESMYRPKVQEFVSGLTFPDGAGKYTMYYTVVGGECTATFAQYAGVMETAEEEEETKE